MEQIEQKILSHIQSELVSNHAGQLDADTELAGVIDSTAIMELVVWIEGAFGFAVEVDDIHPDNFGSVRLISQWVHRNTDGKAA